MTGTEEREERRAGNEAGRRPTAREIARAAAVLSLLVSAFLWPLFTGRALSQSGALREMVPWRGDAAPLAPPLPGTRAVNRVLDDQSREFLPFFLVARDSVREGELPLWNPTIFAGTPLLADAQSAVLFPLNAGHYLLPPPWGFTASAVAKLLLAGLAAWFLGRILGQSNAAATVSGIAWAFCSFGVFWLSHPHTNATALFPLLLAAAEAAVDRPGPRTRVALAVLVALQLLGGHVEIAFLEAVAGAAWVTTRCLQAGRPAGGAFATWIGGHLLGAAMGAIVLFPFVEFLLDSSTWAVRSSANPFFLPQVAWWSLLAPGLFASPGWGAGPNLLHALAPSVGLAALLLAAVAILARPSGPRLAFAVQGALGWAIATGPGPVAALLLRLPLFRQNPNYYAVLLSLLACAMLAGFGVDELAPEPSPGRPDATAKAVARARRSLAIAGGAIALALAWLASGGGSTLEAAFTALGAESPGTVAASLARTSLRSLPLLALAAAACAALASPWHARARAAVAGIVFAELWLAGSAWNPWVRADEALPPRPASIEAIGGEGPAPPRVAAAGEVLPPGTGIFAGLHDVRGYDVPVLATFHAWFGRALGGRDTFWVYDLPRLRPEASDFLDAAAVGWTIDAAADAAADGPVSVATRATAFPRAYFVSAAEPAADADAALERVLALGSRLRETVVIEGEPGLAGPETVAAAAVDDATGRPRPARITSYAPRRVEVEVDAPGPGWLVLADAHHDGWQATVDGVAAPVRRANALFRAVRLDAGSHRVRFVYDPASVRLGLVAGVLSLGYALSRWRGAR